VLIPSYIERESYSCLITIRIHSLPSIILPSRQNQPVMKRINQYKKLFNVTPSTDLATLKKTYRNLVKEWHPDKFQESDPMHEEAKLKGKEVIDGYHFLVSIAPETKEANEKEYLATIETGIDDFQHKGMVLEVTFLNGATYEYFGINKKAYLKFLNADKQMRFAKRNIFHSVTYRRTKKAQEEEKAVIAL